MPSCGGSQGLQVGEQPKLRGHAAGQALVPKVPARGAPEREEGSRGVPVDPGGIRSAAGGRCAVCLAPTRRHHPTPPPYARAALCPPPAPLSQPLQAGIDPPRRMVHGTGWAVQRSAQLGAAVGAVAERRVV